MALATTMPSAVELIQIKLLQDSSAAKREEETKERVKF